MPRKLSAGLLLHRRVEAHGDGIEVLLAHMGGPFWANKDVGAWSIPKGEYEPGDDPLAAARREFAEEMGSAPPLAGYRELGTIVLPAGKLVTAWAVEAGFDATTVVSNTFEIEWPPRSGRIQTFPEIDRAGWFTVDEARVKLVKGQRPFLDRVLEATGRP